MRRYIVWYKCTDVFQGICCLYLEGRRKNIAVAGFSEAVVNMHQNTVGHIREDRVFRSVCNWYSNIQYLKVNSLCMMKTVLLFINDARAR
jgi:hypothetical protein